MADGDSLWTCVYRAFYLFTFISFRKPALLDTSLRYPRNTTHSAEAETATMIKDVRATWNDSEDM